MIPGKATGDEQRATSGPGPYPRSAGTADSRPRLNKGRSGIIFVQIIDFHTSDIERVRQVNEDWRRATEGKRTIRRELLARDHSDPSRYFAVVFFDSCESAMGNSNLPETMAAAVQYMKMSDSPPVFHDLDILEDRA